MKRMCIVLTLLACGGMTAEVHAQDQKDSSLAVIHIRPHLDPEHMQYILSTDRKRVFEQNMKLEAQQRDIFWGVYHRYEKEKEELDSKRLRLLGSYIKNFGTLSDEDVTKMMQQSSANQQATLALRQKYFKMYSKKLGPVAAARFAQLDDLIEMVTRLAILGNIPLLGEVPASDISRGSQAFVPQEGSDTTPADTPSPEPESK